MSEIEHGSGDTAYRRCRQRPEGSCAACKRTAAERVQQWRDKQPDKGRSRGLAARRAQTRLAAMYPDDYQTLLAEELAQ